MSPPRTWVNLPCSGSFPQQARFSGLERHRAHSRAGFSACLGRPIVAETALRPYQGPPTDRQQRRARRRPVSTTSTGEALHRFSRMSASVRIDTSPLALRRVDANLSLAARRHGASSPLSRRAIAVGIPCVRWLNSLALARARRARFWWLWLIAGAGASGQVQRGVCASPVASGSPSGEPGCSARETNECSRARRRRLAAIAAVSSVTCRLPRFRVGHGASRRAMPLFCGVSRERPSVGLSCARARETRVGLRPLPQGVAGFHVPTGSHGDSRTRAALVRVCTIAFPSRPSKGQR